MTLGSHPGSVGPRTTVGPCAQRAARSLTRQGPPQERRALPSGALGDEAAPPGRPPGPSAAGAAVEPHGLREPGHVPAASAVAASVSAPSDQALRRYMTGSLVVLQPAGLDQEVDGVGPLGPAIFGTRRQHRWDPAAVGVLAAAPVVQAEPALADHAAGLGVGARPGHRHGERLVRGDRKSTRLNSSHVRISYAVFCLKKKKK